MTDNVHKGSLGLFSCVTMIVGGMIGSAVFSLTGLTVFNAGPAAVVSWAIAAIIMLCYGLIIAELATIYPKSGGVFVFPSKAIGKNENTGKLWGWISVWGYINANIVAIAFAAMYVGTYLGAGFPVFANMQIPLGVISIIIIFILNIIRFSVTGKTNTVLVIGLATTLLVYACIALFSGKWDTAMLSPFFTQGVGGSTGFLASVPTAMIGYGSIVAIAFMVSEVKDPNKNVPRSMLIAMIIVFAIYALVILSTVGLVSAQFLKDNAGMRFIPLYAAAFTKLSGIKWLAKLISISALLALLTTMLVVMALTSRAVVASAEGGIFPKKFAQTGKAGTPIYATILVAALSMILSFFPQFTAQMVGLAAIFASLTISINCISFIAARKKQAYKEGNFRAPGGVFLSVFTLIILVVCYIPDIIKGGWLLWAYSLGWYAIGLLIYKIRNNKLK